MKVKSDTSAPFVDATLTRPFCDVIGCDDEPSWVRVLSQDGISIDYLCDHHRQQLKSRESDCVSPYTYIARSLECGSYPCVRNSHTRKLLEMEHAAEFAAANHTEKLTRYRRSGEMRFSTPARLEV